MVKNPFKLGVDSKKEKKITTFYCIGDDGVSNQYFYSYLQLDIPEECQELKITIKELSSNEFIEVYDFPTDKMLRNALELYFNILPPPDLLLYFLKGDALPKQIRDWIKLINSTHSTTKMVFISDVTTYREREKIISRVGMEFQFHILENICFSSLQPHSIHKMMANLGNIGVQINTAVCLRPTLRQRMKEKLNCLSGRVKKMIKNVGKSSSEESVV